MNTKQQLFAIIHVCKFVNHFIGLIIILLDFSELAQKGRAEREAKRALHEAGVAKKKEIITRSVVIKSERQVKSKSFNSRLQCFLFQTRLSELEENLKGVETELKQKEGLRRRSIG